jgi:hypothetical protein
MARIPFKMPDQGFREIKGYVYLDAGHLVIEVENSLMGEFDRDFRTFQIELAALERVELETGLLRDHLLVTPKNVELLEKMSIARASYVDLPIWRKHRSAVEDLVRLIGLSEPF